MTPNFALGLTDLGITLWKRDTDQWLRMGAVAMDAPDMEQQVHALVEEARAYAPDGFVTKLVIPEDQILYTHLPVSGDDAAIRAALEGKTPYPVEELDFDYIPQGDGVLAAVVARETLVEAEDFAKAQGLNPVCFVAAPDGRGFSQEPFFKTTRGVRHDPEDLGRGGPILREAGVFVPPKPEETASEDPAAKAPVAASPNAENAPATPTDSDTEQAKDAPAGEDIRKDDPEPATATAPATTRQNTNAAVPENPANARATTAKAPKFDPVRAAKASPQAADPKAEAPASFRSRRAPPGTPAKAPTAPTARPGAAKNQPGHAAAAKQPTKEGGFSSGRLGGAGLVETLRNSLGAPVSRAGNGLRSATDLLGRKLSERSAKNAAPAPQTKSKAAPAKAVASPPETKSSRPKAAPMSPSQPRVHGHGARSVAAAKAASLAAKTGRAGQTKPDDPEAERLTVFGARRGSTVEEPSLPKRALLISGAALMLVLAVAIWTFYFSRAGVDDVAQPVLPEDTTTEVAAPDPLTLPDPEPDEAAEIEAALGATDAAQEQSTAVEQEAEDSLAEPMTAEANAPEVATPESDAGRLAALRSVRAISPDAPGSLPSVQRAPDPFGSAPLPPLREELAAVAPTTEATPDPATAESPVERSLPEGEDALEVVVTQGSPAVVPPARPEGIAPEPPAPAEAEAVANAVADAQAALEQPTDPLDESSLVIDVTPGAPAVTPPARPADIAPEPVVETPPDPAADDPVSADPAPNEADQASLAPPPGGVALTFLAPAPRPEQIVEEATARAEQFASATAQAVAASLRPSNRPSGFSQNVQRALAAARLRQAAPPAAEPQIVQASAASVAPRIPSSASVSRAATQSRAINLRQINLLGVMGTPSARRALVRLDNGRVVTVRVGERLDGGQVTAIGDSELRYTKRGRDLVLRIAS